MFRPWGMGSKMKKERRHKGPLRQRQLEQETISGSQEEVSAGSRRTCPPPKGRRAVCNTEADPLIAQVGEALSTQ